MPRVTARINARITKGLATIAATGLLAMAAPTGAHAAEGTLTFHGPNGQIVQEITNPTGCYNVPEGAAYVVVFELEADAERFREANCAGLPEPINGGVGVTPGQSVGIVEEM